MFGAVGSGRRRYKRKRVISLIDHLFSVVTSIYPFPFPPSRLDRAPEIAYTRNNIAAASSYTDYHSARNFQALSSRSREQYITRSSCTTTYHYPANAEGDLSSVLRLPRFELGGFFPQVVINPPARAKGSDTRHTRVRDSRRLIFQILKTPSLSPLFL